MSRGTNSLKTLVFVVLTVFALACPAMAQEVKVGAGAAPAENIFSRVKEAMEKSTGIKLVLVANGPVEAFKDLDKGAIDAAAGGLTFADWLSLMDREGYSIPDKSIYKSRVIGKDIVKVVVNKDVSMKGLTGDQLKAIFTGKITSWKEIGGPDLPVKVVLGSKIPGTQAVFQKQVLGLENYTRDAVEATTAPDVRDKVAATPGGVGLGPVSIVDSSISAPEIPEVGRPVTLITRGAPSPDVLKMLDFISGEGQKYIAR